LITRNNGRRVTVFPSLDIFYRKLLKSPKAFSTHIKTPT
jgi:hypothetical protein